MQRVARWITRHPWHVLAALLGLTLVAAAGVVGVGPQPRGLRVDPSLQKLIPADAPGRLTEAALRERFGVRDRVVVVTEDDELFSRAGLDRLATLEARLADVDGVERATSLSSLPRVWSARELDPEGAASLAGPAARPPAGMIELAALAELDLSPELARRALLADPLFRGSLLSANGRAAAVVLDLDPASETERLESGLDRRIAEAAAGDAASTIWLAGAPLVQAEMSRILVSELSAQVPMVLLLMLVVSGVAFRTLTGTWLPTAAIGLALFWTLGAMAWADHAVNLVTSIVPPLVLVVGFAYSVHTVAEHRATARELAPGARVSSALVTRRALGRVARAIALTALTTAAGLLSLRASALDVVREFALWGSVGVLAALLSALTFVPAVLALSRLPDRWGNERRSRRADAAFEWIARFDLRHRRAILAAGAGLLVASVLAARGIEVDTRIVDNFRASTPLRVGYERINELFDGADSFHVVIEGPGRQTLLEPARLAEIRALQDWIAAQPEVGGASSYLDPLAAIHRAAAGPGAGDLPASRKLAAQLLWLAGDDATLGSLDAHAESAAIQVRSRATSTAAIGRLVDRIETRLERLGTGLEGSVVGRSVSLARAVDDVSRGQVLGLATAFAIIYVILSLYFRSAGLGLLALLPNALPVAVYFGALGVTGVPLNNATALLGCVVLGIAVDDTLHLLARHREEAMRVGSEQAVIAAVARVGRPVTWTTVALCLGLGVLTTSQLATQAQFGALGAFTLLVAWAVDLVVTPALCSLLPAPDAARARPNLARVSHRAA